MNFVRFATSEGMLYVPTGEVIGVLVRSDGGGEVRFRDDTPRQVANPEVIIEALRHPGEPPSRGGPNSSKSAVPSLFDSIFGGTAG